MQKKHLDSLLLLGYSLFFISLVFAVRPLNSIAIAFLALIGLLFRFSIQENKQIRKNTRLFWLSCFLFYLLYILSLLYTSNYAETLRQLQLKSSLVFVPLFLVLYRPSRRQLELYNTVYIFSLLIAVVFCLLFATYKTMFREASGSDWWFYHALVSPFKQHAVLFSMLIFFALTDIVDRFHQKEYLVNFWFHGLVLTLFIGFLFLLSSKLIISGFILYVLAFITRVVRNRSITIFSISVLFITIVGLFATVNPISNRFREIVEGDMSMISQPKFSQGTYFNGLQFRLIQWKNVAELLDENNAVILGLSPGNAQEKLNEKYISKDMYYGTVERHERGFLGYNTHNQFLESTLHLGITGLTVFLFMIAGLILLCLKGKSTQLWFVVGMLLAFCLTESVLETQYGLVIFTFFPVFFYYRTIADKPIRIS
ncbi:O-antigen ligase family protein [Flavitalea sp.]|nr:O-antigen ligase family protein [Flavitalea sp.]